MRAVVASGKGPASVLSVSNQLSLPALGAGEVKIRIAATAVNRADILQRKGMYPPPPGASPILGLEAAGIVEEVSQPSPFAVGDRVAALLAGGGYASHCVVPSQCCFRVPPQIPLTRAAAIPETFLTAYQALFVEGRMQPHESVLIHAGASGVGTAGAQMAIHANASRVILTCSGRKVDLVKELMNKCCDAAGRPHDTVVVLARDARVPTKPPSDGDVSGGGTDASRPPSPRGSFPFSDAVIAATGGKGVDVVVDPVFGTDYLHEGVRCVATGARWVVLAMMGGSTIGGAKPAAVAASASQDGGLPPLESANVQKLLRARVSLLFSTLRARPLPYKADLVARFVREFGSRLAAAETAHCVWPVVDAEYTVDEVVAAHERVETNETIGKVIVVVDPALK